MHISGNRHFSRVCSLMLRRSLTRRSIAAGFAKRSGVKPGKVGVADRRKQKAAGFFLFKINSPGNIIFFLTEGRHV